MNEVTIDIKSRELNRALRRAARQANDLAPAWKKIGEQLLESVQENFAAGGRPKKWTALSAGSLVSSKAKKQGGKILQGSGKLLDSITYDADGSGVQIGSDLIYAAAHQYGADHIPARPYLLIHPEDEAAMAEILEEHFAG